MIWGSKPIFSWSRNQINTLYNMADLYYVCERTKNMTKSKMAANFTLHFGKCVITFVLVAIKRWCQVDMSHFGNQEAYCTWRYMQFCKFCTTESLTRHIQSETINLMKNGRRCVHANTIGLRRANEYFNNLAMLCNRIMCSSHEINLCEMEMSGHFLQREIPRRDWLLIRRNINALLEEWRICR